ncbi:Nn.00g089960.m01.CDS01 [Neocucurbitaria sp. VM-36]
MAESEQPVDKSLEVPNKGKEFTITLTSPDGTYEATALLEQNEDATQPPRLINVTRQPLPSPNTASTAGQRATHVILSVGSGHQKAADFFQHVVSPLLSLLYGPEGLQTFKMHMTQSETSILDLTNEVLFPEANGTSATAPGADSAPPEQHEGKPLRIILLSGDGGVVDLVNGLSSKPLSPQYIAPQVTLLPLGTANALYHSINANSGTDNTWGLHALSSRTSKPLPVFTASFSPGARLLVDEARAEEPLPTNEKGDCVLHGAVVCSWGMHASLVADSDTSEYREFGIDRFKMAAKEALYPSDGGPPHPYKGRVSVLKNGEWTPLPEEEHMYVLATLVSNLERPFCISPASKPLDGSLHLVHFGPTSGDEAMRIMGLAYQGGKHVDDPAVRYEAIDGLRIELKDLGDARWRRICVDGKIVRVERDGWVEIRKEERRVLDVVV